MSADARIQIRQFVTAKFPQVALADDQDIFALGFVNSLFAMELVMFIEKTFAVKIPNEELKLDNFRTLDAMSTLVGQLSGSTPATVS